MLVIPAIDLKGGRLVRLFQGRMDQEAVYSSRPVDAAREWAAQGAGLIHVVDLDGAYQGRSVNLPSIKDILGSVDVPIQVGGGIRDIPTIEEYLSLGIKRIIIGSAAFENHALVLRASERFPGMIWIALDMRRQRLSTRGWTEDINTDLLKAVGRFEGMKIGGLIYTDILRDGTLTGPNVEEARDIAQSTALPLIVSGGISSLGDIDKVMRLEGLGVAGMIVGKALYEGRFNLKEAIERARSKV